MPKVIVLCATCGKEFEKYTDSRYPNKRPYCSRKCTYERNGPRKEIVCPNCGKINIVAHYSKKKFCNNKCYRKYTVGDKHPRFGVEISQELRDKISNSLSKKSFEHHTKLVNKLYNELNSNGVAIIVDNRLIPDIIYFSSGKVIAIEVEKQRPVKKLEKYKKFYKQLGYNGYMIYDGNFKLLYKGGNIDG